MAEVVVPAELSARARHGEIYYNAVCASCQGANAAGQDGIAPPFVHRIYEPSHHGDIAFILEARNEVRAHHWQFGDMPPVEQPLTDGELGVIVYYVREFQRANGIKCFRRMSASVARAHPARVLGCATSSLRCDGIARNDRGPRVDHDIAIASPS